MNRVQAVLRRMLVVVLGALIGWLGITLVLDLFYRWYMPRYDTGFDHQTRQLLIVMVLVPLFTVIGAVVAWRKTRPRKRDSRRQIEP